jgi:signal transduction histidine kinase
VLFRSRDDVPPVVEIRGETTNGQCLLTVSDNGIGFDEKYADRIFTMFERLHARTKYEGTGIGLAICRKRAERHGGEIRAHGRPGEGARFVVTLPVKQGEVRN